MFNGNSSFIRYNIVTCVTAFLTLNKKHDKMFLNKKGENMIKYYLKYKQVSNHLKKEAMKQKFKNSRIDEMNYNIEIDDKTGKQKKIVGVSADVSSQLSQLLKIG